MEKGIWLLASTKINERVEKLEGEEKKGSDRCCISTENEG